MVGWISLGISLAPVNPGAVVLGSVALLTNRPSVEESKQYQRGGAIGYDDRGG